jgi:hypothetical protein
MKPSDSNYMTYDLPDGSTVALFASGDNRAGEWTYLWMEFDREAPVHYRTYLVGTPPGEWLPMNPTAEVYKLTGFKDEEDDADGARLGAAAKLAEGRYILQGRIVIEGMATELPGVTFDVQPSKRKRK